MVYRGVGADFEKPKQYFRLIMKKIYLENFKPLYTFLFNTYFTSVVPTALLLQCNWPITGIRRVL